MNDNAEFIDVHVHLKSADAFSDVARAGIAAVRDAGLKINAERGILMTRSADSCPIVLSAGWAIYKNGSYGSILGIPVETRDDIKNEILRLKTAGAAIIKVVGSGIVDLEPPFGVTPGGFSGEELKYIVESAHDVGLEVMVHANGEDVILRAVEAGVRSVEHGFFMTERALELMADRHIFWVPTIGALARAADAHKQRAAAREYAHNIIAGHMTMIRKAFDYGVPLAVGTDSVLPDAKYQEYYKAELSYLESAGLRREDVLAIAIEGGRRLLEIQEDRRII